MLKSLLRPVFRAAVRVYDPIVRQNIHGASVLLPISHGLPRCVQANPFYDTALPAWCKFLADRLPAGKRLSVIDVGANIGDTAVLVAHAAPNTDFICIEADPAYLPLLKRNTEGLRVKIFDVALGDKTTISHMQIVHARRGTSSISEATDGSELKTMRLDDILVQSPMVPDVLKIDTDGFEGPILRGATSVLASQGASIFIEFSPWHLETYGKERPEAILGALREAKYTSAIVYDNEGYPMGLFQIDDAFVQNLATYCSRRPNFYVDILASKDAVGLTEFYATETRRYPVAPWVEHR